MYYQLIVLGLVCLAAPWLARLGGYETHRKPFDMVGVGGIFFLLAASFGLGFSLIVGARDVVFWAVLTRVLMICSFVLGWIALGIGAIWSTLEVWHEPERSVAKAAL